MKYIIYKIEIKDYLYIGSTKNYTNRKSQHKHGCNSECDRLVYNKINELGGWIKTIMTPIEEIECDNKIQALIREEYHRKELKANLNTISCYNTVEDTKAKSKEYRKVNREHILEVKKEHYHKYQEENKIKSKEYYNSHRDEQIKKQCQYHKDNIETIHLRNNQVIICECGKSYTCANKARHLKTKFHLDNKIYHP